MVVIEEMMKEAEMILHEIKPAKRRLKIEGDMP